MAARSRAARASRARSSLAVREEIGPERLLGVTVTAAMDGYEEAVAHLRGEHCDIDYAGVGHGNYEAAVPDRAADGVSSPGTASVVRERRAKPRGTSTWRSWPRGASTGPRSASEPSPEGACDLVG